ncbi:MAG: hypothetical protein CMJ84_06255 [Planctomycetes bacterium]|jgi:hypothetical protein|nr:hypothetical protein [Planctomycetota bacterium]MDP6408297.1 hypothetical protein [Planctomycetota bacterium]
MKSIHLAGSASLLLASLPAAGAQEAAPAPGASFLPPVRLMAGEEFLGAKRRYPSPALFDVDGDGHADLVVADLSGRPTVALGVAGEPQGFGPETALRDADGEKLDFNNW